MGLFNLQNLPFVPISIITGVMIGLLYRRNTANDRLAIVTLAMVNGLVSAILSTLLVSYLYKGYTGNVWGDALQDMLENLVNSSGFNILLAELFINLPDSVISILAALLLLRISDAQKEKILARRKQKKGKEAVSGILLLCLLAPVLFSSEAYAGDGETDLNFDYEEVYYGSNDGLLSPEANTVLQTQDGYLWVGTYSGLYRYDGISFEEVELHDSIRNVKTLFEDSKGRLWAGSNDSGVLCYDRTTEEGILYNTDNGMPSDSIRCICEDNKGNIYVSTDREMAKITAGGEIKLYKEWAEIGNVSSFASIGDGHIVGVTKEGILFMFKDDILLYTKRYATTGIEYSVVATDGTRVVVGTTQADLEVYRVREDGLEYYKKIKGAFLSGYNRIRYDADFNLYFCCCENGMGYLNPDNHDEIQYFSISEMYSSVDDVCVDSQKNIWFASLKYGLVKYSFTPFRNLYRKAEMEKDVVNALYKDGETLYIGTDNGLRVVDLAEDCLPQYPRITEWVMGNRVRHIDKDSKGNLWISIYGGDGLLRMDAEGEIHTVDFSEVGLSDPHCRFVKELSDGSIAVSCARAGLVILKDDKPVALIGEKEGMSNTAILSLYEREDGILMAGSDGDGIYLIRDGRLVGHISRTEGLHTGVVMKIIPCTEGLLYVTSNALYYDHAGEIRRLENFPYYNNFDVITDGSGRAWVVSSAGLYVVDEQTMLADPENYSCTLLDEDWGFTSSFNANAWNMLDGTDLYLCCVDGVRIIDTQDYNKAEATYEMGLKMVETQDEQYTQIGKRLVLPPVAGRIRFHITVTNFTLSNPLIHYYLEGTEDPGFTCYQNEIQPLSFTNLPYGSYTFHISVLDDATGVVLRDEKIEIVKEAQMYEKPYFTMYLMLINSLMLGYFTWLFLAIHSRNKRIRSLRKEIQTDPMTGLLNKAGSHKVLEKTCKEEAGTLLMIDLDSFKLVNDLYGHDMGDRILIRFAELIREAVGEKDPAGRLGGDEFIAFLKNTMDEDDVAEVCRILNQGIVKSAKEYMGEDMNIPLGASIGAVRVPLDGNEFDEVFRLADKALYNVKQNGKHGYAFYQRSGEEKTKEQQEAEQGALTKIMQVIGERNEGKGAYFVNFDRMQVLYRYLKRESLRGRKATFARISLSHKDNGTVTDEARETIEDTLIRGLKKNDVVSVFSGNYFVLVSDAEVSECEEILKGITDTWQKTEEKNRAYQIRIDAESLG